MKRTVFLCLWPGILAWALLASSACREGSMEAENAEKALPPGVAMTLVVSPQGDNSGAAETGWVFSTLEEALQAARPGDCVQVLPGVYHESLDLYWLGEEDAPITIRGAGEGVIFDGQRELTFGFWCTECRGLVIENLVFRNYTDFGIGVNESSQITLRDLTVFDNGFEVQLKKWELEGYGILIDVAADVMIEDCETYRNGPQPKKKHNMMGTGINVFGCTDCVVHDNCTHDNIGGGMLVEDSLRVLVEDNEIYANDLDATVDEWWDGAIWVDGGADITVRGNTIRDNLGPGIQISDEDDQDPTGYVFESNRVTGNTYGLFIWGFETSDYPPQDVLFLKDNQISGNTRQDVVLSPGFCLPGETC